MQDSMSWGHIKKRREEVKKLYTSIFRVPILYATKRQLIHNILEKMNGKVLDIGGGDRFIAEICASSGKKIEYKSMDIDNTRFHDYYSLDEIQERFDAIFLLDVIEHLSLGDGKTLLEKCSQVLQPSGKIVVTMPNNNHPTAFQGDCTHIISYRYHELGGLLLSSGFKELQIFRVAAKRKWKHRLLALLLMPVMKFLDIDFATGILIIAEKAS